MSAEISGIISAYTEGLTPEQIAEDRDLDIVAVKACLMQNSAQYRKDCGKEDEAEDNLNFSNEELRRANEVIFGLAIAAESEELRFKAATYVRDDKKGRKEVVKAVAGQQFNIMMINEKMAQVRDAANRMKQAISVTGAPAMKTLNA